MEEDLDLLRTMNAHHSMQLCTEPVFIREAPLVTICTPEQHENDREVPRLMRREQVEETSMREGIMTGVSMVAASDIPSRMIEKEMECLIQVRFVFDHFRPQPADIHNW